MMHSMGTTYTGTNVSLNEQCTVHFPLLQPTPLATNTTYTGTNVSLNEQCTVHFPLLQPTPLATNTTYTGTYVSLNEQCTVLSFVSRGSTRGYYGSHACSLTMNSVAHC